MKLTEEQKNKVDGLLYREMMYETKTSERIDSVIKHIEEVVGPDWVVAYRPPKDAKDSKSFVEFIIGNKERAYIITLAPHKLDMVERDWR